MILCPSCGTVPTNALGPRLTCGCGMFRGPFGDVPGGWYYGRRLHARLAFDDTCCVRIWGHFNHLGDTTVTGIPSEDVPDAIREITVETVLED